MQIPPWAKWVGLGTRGSSAVSPGVRGGLWRRRPGFGGGWAPFSSGDSPRRAVSRSAAARPRGRRTGLDGFQQPPSRSPPPASRAHLLLTLGSLSPGGTRAGFQGTEARPYQEESLGHALPSPQVSLLPSEPDPHPGGSEPLTNMHLLAGVAALAQWKQGPGGPRDARVHKSSAFLRVAVSGCPPQCGSRGMKSARHPVAFGPLC